MQNFNEFHFKGQKLGEKILLVTHRHWFDILSQFFIILVMILLLLASCILTPIFFPSLVIGVNATLLSFLQNLFLLVAWMLFFVIWIDYYFDVWIVTDERIVNIEQKSLFSRSISELELENIQDITVEVLGVIPTFLNYGNLYVQTAAEKERFIFQHVPDPYAIKNLVMNLQKSYEKKEAHDLGAVIRKEIHEELN